MVYYIRAIFAICHNMLRIIIFKVIYMKHFQFFYWFFNIFFLNLKYFFNFFLNYLNNTFCSIHLYYLTNTFYIINKFHIFDIIDTIFRYKSIILQNSHAFHVFVGHLVLYFILSFNVWYLIGIKSIFRLLTYILIYIHFIIIVSICIYYYSIHMSFSYFY